MPAQPKPTTTKPSRTKPSTQRLSEVAKHLVYPSSIVANSWPRIERRLSEMAIRYDGWQSGACRLILGRDESDRYAATVGGVTMSLPRQVGKTFTVGSLLVAMCVEYPDLRVVWTSHHLRTTTNTFRSMQGMVRRKKVWPNVEAIRTANGEQEIRFTNGSIIMFGARERGFGVGIDAIDILVCDEAQRLTSRSAADMMPTTNQARHVHGALVFYIGTPPRPTDDGDEFAAKRRKAIAGELTNGIYVELSADPDADLADPKQWARANPSYPHRTPHESMLRLRENLSSDDDWRHEAMGIWDDDGLPAVFGPGAWPACATDEAPPHENVTFAITRSLDLAYTSIGSAIPVGDDWHVGPARYDRSFINGEEWVVSGAAALQDQFPDAVFVVNGRSPAGSLIPELEKAGVKVLLAATSDDQDAASQFYDLVQEGRIRHRNYPELNGSVETAQQHFSGGRWSWLLKGWENPTLAAVSLARWGAEQPKEKKLVPMVAFL